MEYRFTIEFNEADGWTTPEYLRFPGDVYIEVQIEYPGNEDYAMELLAWAEQALPGDMYIDTNVIIRAL